jgi:hypothetical protein
MRAEELENALRERGLIVLGVAEFRGNPEVLVVYLRGNAGQRADRETLDVVSVVPEVVNVCESIHTPTILLARVTSSPGSSAGDAAVPSPGPEWLSSVNERSSFGSVAPRRPTSPGKD